MNDRKRNTTKENSTFVRDGNMVCCQPYWFTNLQECPAGFGVDEDEAYKNLMEQL